MTLETNLPAFRRAVPRLSSRLLGALLALPAFLAAPQAAAERDRGAQAAGTAASAPAASYTSPAPPPSSPSPSFSPAEPRSAPASTAPVSYSPTRSAGSHEGSTRSGSPRGVVGRQATPPRSAWGASHGSTFVSPGRRGSYGDRYRRPARRYRAPRFGWGTSWWWGGPWDWWWWGGGPWWGWGGGVVVVRDYDPLPDRYARVDTDVSPEAAEVYLDGTYIGCADDFDGYPDYLYLEPGKYRLEFRHPSYETLVKELSVHRGQEVRIDENMKLLPGKGKMSAFDPERKGMPYGRVFGKGDAGRAGRAADRTGRYEAKDGRDARTDDVEELDEPDDLDEPDADVDDDAVEPARPAERKAPAAEGKIEPAPRPTWRDEAPASRSRIRFEVGPRDAAVYLDDRYIGTAEELVGLRRGLPVDPGKHTVTVLRPGYGAKTVDVETKPGAAIDVVVELEK